MKSGVERRDYIDGGRILAFCLIRVVAENQELSIKAKRIIVDLIRKSKEEFVGTTKKTGEK